MIIALDTETDGPDFKHGAKAFLVTIATQDGNTHHYEWSVDPLTRVPEVVKCDLDAIQTQVDAADEIVLQNAKFDVAALESVFSLFNESLQWPWHKVQDTLIAGHLLNSNQSHTLSDMVMLYLRKDMDPLEAKVRQATEECRRWARSNRKQWMIAKPGLPCMPSAKGQVWKLDMWLPRCVAKELDLPKDHIYWSVCSNYANSDSENTLALWFAMLPLLRDRKLVRIYQERLKVLQISYMMQERGVTLSRTRIGELTSQFSKQVKRGAATCKRIAKQFGVETLELPKSGGNKSLSALMFRYMKIPVHKRSPKTGAPSLDKYVLDHYADTLDGPSLEFVQALRDRRKRMTALQYLEGYRKFMLPVDDTNRVVEWYRLHPSLNPTGTDTLRWSSQNPNEQNISKQEGLNLRYVFGPLPGRQWCSLDAENIELRIPAYVAEEPEMIDLFERPNESPYYGSYHLLVFHLLWGHKLRKAGYDPDVDPEALLKAKRKYKSTWYQWTKNGNFAVQYGAVVESGTADRAYHIDGAHLKVQRRFSRIASLNQEKIRYARKHGYVETIPDRSVDPKRGYPLQCPVDAHGNVVPTIPLNYFVQGTAMWWMMRSMIRCSEFLERYNRDKPQRGRVHMIMQVHDELVFDFPAQENGDGVAMAQHLRKLMARGGDDIGIPTPVGIECHPDNWAEYSTAT